MGKPGAAVPPVCTISSLMVCRSSASLTLAGRLPTLKGGGEGEGSRGRRAGCDKCRGGACWLLRRRRLAYPGGPTAKRSPKRWRSACHGLASRWRGHRGEPGPWGRPVRRAGSSGGRWHHSLDALGGARCIRVEQLVPCLQLRRPVAVVRQRACAAGRRERRAGGPGHEAGDGGQGPPARGSGAETGRAADPASMRRSLMRLERLASKLAARQARTERVAARHTGGRAGTYEQKHS